MHINLEIFFNILQLIGGIILSIGYAPQIWKTFRTKKVDDLSLPYYVNVFIGVALMEAYSIYNILHGVASMFFITNTIALVCCTTMMVLTYLYSRPKHIQKMQKLAKYKRK